MNNGFFWRGDAQGQAAGRLHLDHPPLAIGLDIEIPINIPVTGTLGIIVNGLPIITIRRSPFQHCS